MLRHFEELEQEIRNSLLRMGGLVEEMIHLAISGLINRNEETLLKVQGLETEVNQLHIQVDDQCLKLLALHHPAADDLRLVMAVIKINADLERVGDQAVNISQSSRIFIQFPQLERALFDIPRMAELAKGMLKESLDAFVRKDVELAKAVVKKDAEEDKMKSEAFHELLHLMQSDSSTIQRALTLILIARNLERIADHATNIAEDVIFMVLGQDIRHHSLDKAISL